MLLVAYKVDGVSTWHEHDGCRRIKQVFAANGTATLERAIETFVRRVMFSLDAACTSDAMHIVFALASSTNFAFLAVKDLLVGIIIPKIANRAKVPCQALITVCAGAPSSLRSLAKETQAIENTEAVYCVVLLFVVAEATWIPVAAAFGPQFAVGSVVGASKDLDLGLLLTIVRGLAIRLINVKGSNVAINVTGARARVATTGGV